MPNAQRLYWALSCGLQAAISDTLTIVAERPFLGGNWATSVVAYRQRRYITPASPIPAAPRLAQIASGNSRRRCRLDEAVERTCRARKWCRHATPGSDRSGARWTADG